MPIEYKKKQFNFYGFTILMILGLSSLFYFGLRVYSMQFMEQHLWFSIYSLIGEGTLISSNVWYCFYLLY